MVWDLWRRISRFDPSAATSETAWTTYTTADGLASAYVWRLHVARDGTVWAGFRPRGPVADASSTGISRYRAETGAWETIDGPAGNLRPAVRAIADGRDGSVWFATDKGPLRFKGGSWSRYKSQDGLVGWGVLESHDGSVWFTHPNGLSQYDGTKWTTHELPHSSGETLSLISIWQTTDGTIWSGGGAAGLSGSAGSRLFRFRDEKWESFSAEDVPWLEQVSAVWHGMGTREGDIWLGRRNFVARVDFNSTRWTTYTDVPDAILSRYASDVLTTIDENVWLGATIGAIRFDGEQWLSYTAADGLIDGQSSAIWNDRNGNVWIGGQHSGGAGVVRHDGIRWHLFDASDGLVGPNVYTGLTARNGDIWIGTKFFGAIGLGVMRYRESEWSVFTTEEGLSDNTIYSLAETPDGSIWVGTLDGLSRFDGSKWTIYRDPDVKPGKIFTLCATRDGSLWIGYGLNAYGVTRYDGKTWTPILNELVDGAVYIIYQSGDDSIWFGTGGGLSRYDGVNWTSYPREEIPVALGPAVRGIGETPDGALWVRGYYGVARFQPDADEPETLLEPASEQISSAGNLNLRWSGLTLWNRTPQQGMRYRWRLDEGEWSPATGQDDLALATLSFGDHTFEVQAMDRDGRVDPSPATLVFVVESPWWRNPWVVLIVLSLVGTTAFQASRVVASNRKLKNSNQALSDANNQLFQVNRDLETANVGLQRDRAMERIRAEVQSMDRAEDFEKVLSLLTSDLNEVGLEFASCEIDVLDQPIENPTMAQFEADGHRYTTYTLDPDGHVASETFAIAAPFPAVIRQTIERFIEGKPWQAVIGGTQSILEVPAGSYGRLRLIATERDQFTDEETATLREFADAVALGYARYLDIREIQLNTERKSAFLASMSHEFRTPMNAIKGFTNLVLRRGKDELSDRNQENLQKVSQASDHLLAMINDLLDLSKIEAGRMDVNVETFDVAELIRSSCDTVSPLVRDGVELIPEVADDIGKANTDRARLQQMVINLLSNAIKFTDQGKVIVTAQSEKENLAITVNDTGKGIPAEELPTLFDEYRQVEGQSESEVQKGTGLGLSITKKFAELLGGSISVESEIGKGTTFTITIPSTYSD